MRLLDLLILLVLLCIVSILLGILIGMMIDHYFSALKPLFMARPPPTIMEISRGPP